MIRILHVIGKMDIGGAETMIMNLYRAMDKSKIQFDFLVHTKEKGVYDEEIELLGGKIYSIIRFNGMNFYEYIKAWKKFLNAHNEYNIIHGHIGSSASIYLSLARKFNRFSIGHSHSTLSGDISLRSMVWRMYSYPARYMADYYFACSLEAGKMRYGNKIINSDRFQILRNAIYSEQYIYSEEKRVEVRKMFGIKEDTLVIGHVGRFDKVKNHTFLIDIFWEIYQINNNSILMLVGDGMQRENILKKVTKLGLNKNVVMVGLRKDVPAFLSAMDVFVFPSRYEGLSLAIIEAQASGMHVLCTDTLPVESSITGLVERISLKRKASYWAKRILLVSNDHVRNNMQKNIIEMGYDIHQTAKEMCDFYWKHWKR